MFILRRWNNQHVMSVRQRKKSESPTEIEPMTSQTPERRSIHWATENSWRARPYTRFVFHYPVNWDSQWAHYYHWVPFMIVPDSPSILLFQYTDLVRRMHWHLVENYQPFARDLPCRKEERHTLQRSLQDVSAYIQNNSKIIVLPETCTDSICSALNSLGNSKAFATVR